MYLPDVDNSALAKAIDLGSHSVTVTLIVPPKHDEMLRSGEPILKERTPSILSLDTLISLRQLFTSGDLGWTGDRVLLDLLRRYNRRAADAACDESILVDLPSDLD